MTLTLRIIARLCVMAIGYIGGMTAGIAFCLLVIYNWSLEVHFGFGGFAGAIALFTLLLTNSHALIPPIMLCFLAELFSLRSYIWPTTITAVISPLIFFSSDLYKQTVGFPPQEDIIVASAAGAVAGFTYWLIASRNAGSWR